MSNTQLYIPKQIHVGFQKRGDTYNGKLSYIIYTDDKGKKRKETSWESWRDKKIQDENYDNEPISGFVLHKDVKRYNWSHFSSKRTLIRVFDPRGMEFEITTDNLLFILQHTDCVKRELVGEFVYSWLGPELILLPKDTEEYRLSNNFTKLQAKKISAKDLIAGVSYKTKREEDLIYVGRHMWYQWDTYREKDRLGKKYHIFYNEKIKAFETKSSVDFLAAQNTTEPVDNFAEIIEKFQKNPHSSKIIKFELVKADIDTTVANETDYYIYIKNNNYFIQDGNLIRDVTLSGDKSYDSNTKKYQFKGYFYHSSYALDQEKQVISYSHLNYYKNSASNDRYYNWNSWHNTFFTESEIKALTFYHLYVTLENGKRTRIKSFNEI